jgi:hypothetical protein
LTCADDAQRFQAADGQSREEGPPGLRSAERIGWPWLCSARQGAEVFVILPPWASLWAMVIKR